jgi:hypothetical protein
VAAELLEAALCHATALQIDEIRAVVARDPAPHRQVGLEIIGTAYNFTLEERR